MRGAPILVLLAACAGIAPPHAEPLGRAPSAAEEAARPRRRAGTHQERWILRRGDTDVVFTLMIEIADGTGAPRFVALDDFGGVLADGEGRDSRALPARVVERIRAAVSARYAPGEADPVRVGDATGWRSAAALHVGREIYAGGLRITAVATDRWEIEGALRATVSGS